MLYNDSTREAVTARLVRVDGVLVWVDPITGSEDRSVLDGVLREVASSGVWVSAHPDVIEQMGTKEVLYRTKHLSWGTDTHFYASAAVFREQFPHNLDNGPRVLKPTRGNGGHGVWKVALHGQPQHPSGPRTEAVVRIQHAAPRDGITEEVDLGAFMASWDGFFVDGGGLIDQPFVSRVGDGMIRVYLVRDQVVGFALQQPDPAMDPDRVLGLPSGKTMFNEDYPPFGIFAPNSSKTGCPACSHPRMSRQTTCPSSGTPIPPRRDDRRLPAMRDQCEFRTAIPATCPIGARSGHRDATHNHRLTSADLRSALAVSGQNGIRSVFTLQLVTLLLR